VSVTQDLPVHEIFFSEYFLGWTLLYVVAKKNLRFFFSFKTRICSANFCFLSPQLDTISHCETTDMGLMYSTMCLFTSQLSLVLIAPTHGRMARLS